MAKFHIERAYIESYDSEESHQILVHIKEGNDHILAGKVELDHDVAWIHMSTAENGDLVINNSAGMESNKWDHITREIVREI
jgi:hypothetical protein